MNSISNSTYRFRSLNITTNPSSLIICGNHFNKWYCRHPFLVFTKLFFFIPHSSCFKLISISFLTNWIFRCASSFNAWNLPPQLKVKPSPYANHQSSNVHSILDSDAANCWEYPTISLWYFMFPERLDFPQLRKLCHSQLFLNLFFTIYFFF